MKITVGQLMEQKGEAVYSVSPQQTVYEALELMADKDVGAVLVLDDEGKIAGIFSERDYARKIILHGKSSIETPVADIMRRQVICVPTWRTLDECMAIMTNKRVRHLPVIRDGELAGIVSIGDVGKAIISEQEYVIHELEEYAEEALKHKKS